MEKKMIKKLLAILMIITILSTDFFVLGSSLITYATTQMEIATNEPNIEFSVYFKNGANEKVSNIDKSIKTEDLRLYASVKVKNEGYFNGAIEIKDGKFKVKREILSSQIAKIDGNRIELKQINAEEPVEIELGLEPIFTKRLLPDMLLKTKVVLSGKYISSANKDGKEIVPAEREVGVSYKVDESAKPEIKSTIMTNTKISENGEEKRIIQVLIRARLEENQYPVESIILTVDVPKLSETSPEKVDFLIINEKSPLITHFWSNKSESMAISMQNIDVDNKITWNKEGYDEVLVTYTYPSTVDASNISINIKPEITVYNSKNKITTDPIELKNSSEINNVVMAKPQIETTELYKGQLYENITAAEKKEVQYNTATTLIVTKPGIVEGVTINEEPDQFLTDKIAVEAETKYISTEIDTEQALEILGANGNITIKNGDTPISEIKNIAEIESDKIIVNYTETVDELNITTSTPVKEGILEIKHTKAIIGSYTRDQIKAIKGLEKVNNIKTTNIEEESSTSIKIKETMSRADLVVISDAKLSTIEPNDLALGITFVTEGLQYDLFESPTITIQMPSYVQNVTFNTAPVIQNVNNNEIAITEYNYYETTNQLVITTSGVQSTYPNGVLSELYIPLDLKVTLSKLAPSEVATIKMLYTNSNASVYYRGTTVGESEQDLIIQAPTGLVKYFNLKSNSNTSITQDITQMLISKDAGSELEFEIAVVNNTGADANNVNILGKLPTTNNAENTMESTLKSLTAPNATVYFTENANATTDVENAENAWTTDLSSLTNAKMYLIKLDTLTKGSNYTALTKVKAPNEIVHGLESYTYYEVSYDLNGNTETESSRKIYLQMISDFEVKLNAEVAEDTLRNGDKVKEGEVVKYTINVTNNTNEITENVQLKANVPSGTVVVEPVEGYVYESDPFYYEEKTDITTIDVIIPKLEVGETYTYEYEVRVNMDAVATVSQIANRASVKYNEFELQTDEIANALEEADIRVTIKNIDDEEVELIAGHVANYAICIENFSNNPLKNLEMQVIADEYAILRTEDINYKDYELDGNNKLIIEEIPAREIITFDLYGQIDSDAEEMNIYVKVSTSGNVHKSNILKTKLPNIEAQINLESQQNDKAIKPGEKVNYNITVKNTGVAFISDVIINSVIPQYLKIESISIDGETKYQVTDKTDKDTYIAAIPNTLRQTVVMFMRRNETAKVNIVAEVKEIPTDVDGDIITTKFDLSIGGVDKGSSEEVKHILDCGQKNMVSGKVWLDENANGRKEESESTLSGVVVKVYDLSKKSYLKDAKGNIIKTDTDMQGKYTLTQIPNGLYIIVFEDGLYKYEPTVSFANGVETTENSKAKKETITLNGETVEVAGFKTDLQDIIMYNVNLGLKDKAVMPPEQPGEPDDPTKPDEPEIPEKEYKKISGNAWLDLDRDGKRDDKESALSGINVTIYNVATKDYLKDKNGSIIQKTTDANGKYAFENIEKGSYILIFGYDTEKYEPTTYLANGVDTTKNSKVVLKKTTINGEEILLAVTDTINVEEDVTNINIGLKEKLKFDLELSKYISRVVVQTSKETKAYDYENTNFAKVEIKRKQLAGSLVVLEYTIKVKNNGEAAGYAKNIVDYLPSGLTFSSELNKDWYLSGNYLYTKSLENVEIQPGQEKEVKLILTKTMTAENTGLVNNRAEIFEDYNEYGETDIDSIPNNQIQDEDDLGSADVIILVATGGGSTIAYIMLLIVNMILIGIAIKLMIKNQIIKMPVKKGRG